MPLSEQLTCSPDDDEEEDDSQTTALLEALETLHDQFEDLNRTPILTHNPRGHLAPLVQHFDHPNVRVRCAAISACAAAWHSHPPVQNLAQNAELGFQMIPQLLARIRAFSASPSKHRPILLALLSALIGLVNNHSPHTQLVLQEYQGFSLLNGLLSAVDERLRAKLLFLLRNMLNICQTDCPQSLLSPIRHSSDAIPWEFLVSSIGAGSNMISELVAAYLELLSQILQSEMLDKCPNLAAIIAKRLSNPEEDNIEEYQSLKSIQSHLSLL